MVKKKKFKFSLLNKKIERATKVHYVISLFIRTTLVLAFLAAVYNQRWAVLFAVVITFILTFLPNFLERRYKIDLPIEFELIIIVFIYASFFLGEIHGYYTKFWWWDIVLHTGSALAFGFVGFMILYVLYKANKIKANPLLIAVFSFCFAVAIGAVWEIFEFSMDQFFGLNMQKSGLLDTMGDLIVDSIGALIASVAGYFYIKRKELFFLGKIIKRFEKDNPDIF